MLLLDAVSTAVTKVAAKEEMVVVAVAVAAVPMLVAAALTGLGASHFVGDDGSIDGCGDSGGDGGIGDGGSGEGDLLLKAPPWLFSAGQDGYRHARVCK